MWRVVFRCRHDDHSGHLQRPDLLWHRCDVEHLCHGRCDCAGSVTGQADQIPAGAPGRAAARESGLANLRRGLLEFRGKTKALFAEKAEAWTVEVID